MFHQFLTHLKAEAAFYSVVGAISSVIVGIGLAANQVTSPKVLAVIVFLADWNMLYTWEWWLRMIIGLAFGALLWWIERIRHKKQLLAVTVTQEQTWNLRTRELRDDFKHLQSLLAARDLELAMLKRRNK